MKTENKRLPLIEAASYCGRSVKTLRNWIASGSHPRYEKERGRVYIWTHDLDAFFAAGREVHEANIRDWNKKAG